MRQILTPQEPPSLITDTDSESLPQPPAWTDFQEAADALGEREAQDTFSCKGPYA